MPRPPLFHWYCKGLRLNNVLFTHRYYKSENNCTSSRLNRCTDMNETLHTGRPCPGIEDVILFIPGVCFLEFILNFQAGEDAGRG